MSYKSDFENALYTLQKQKLDKALPIAEKNLRLMEANNQRATTKQAKRSGGIFQAGALDDGYDLGDIVKIILGTAGDTAVGAGKGFMGFSEGIADTIGYGIYGLRRAFGETENDLAGYKRDIAASTTDKIFGGAQDWLDQYSVLGDTSTSVAEGVGYLGALIGTGGYLKEVAGLGATGANFATNTAMGTSAFGSGMSEAILGGATDGEAVMYGAASAASEILAEKMFGGLGKGLDMVGFNKGAFSFDDMAAKAVSKFISSPTGKNWAQMLVKSGFEGLEEVGTGFAQALAKKLTYMSEEEFGKILKDENLFEQFIVGALVSDIAQAGDVRIANKTGTDLVTGFTKNEQAVIDKEVENRMAQEGGKKLSGKEKSRIYDQVVKDMERGYISTETIESVLGKDALTQYDALSKEAEEFKTLYETEGGKLSEKQKDRLAELKEKNKANPYEQLLKSQREKISRDVSAMAQNDRLGESYNEQIRKGEKFQADVSKYSEAQRKTVQNAIDSGILNNTNRSHEFVDLIAKISADKGISFDFADNAKLKESGFALDGVLVNGFVNENGVTINVQSAKALNRVVGHEITHVLEGTQLYDALQSAVTEYAKGKKEYDSRLKELTELYKGKNANVEQELVADLVGDYLFTDADFIKHLSTEHRNLAQKIYDEIKYLCKIVTAGTKEARQLEKVKKAFADAYRAETKNPTADGGTKYSIVALDNGNVYVRASRNVITGTTKADQRKNITDFFNDLLEGNSSLDIQTIEGDVLTITKAETADKARDDYKTVQGQSVKMTDAEFLVKLRAEAHIDELAEISHKNNRPPVPDGKNHAFAKNGFTYRRAYFEDFDGQYYEITLSIGHNGTVATVYNVGKISKGALPSAKIIAVVGSKALGKTPSTFSLSKTTENVKQKNDVYLDAVSRGDMQTAQQMVDAVAEQAGYTRRMFHETDADHIHVFDITRGDHGATDYETPYGIFTKTSDKNIGLGSRQMALFVKAQNTLYVNDRADVLNKIPGFIQYYDRIQAIDQKYNALAEQFEDAEFDALQIWMEDNPDVDMDEVFPSSYIIEGKPADIDYEPYLEAHRKYMENKRTWEDAYNKVAVQAKEFITEYLRNNKYDSMYFAVDGGSRGRQTDSLIVLDQNQVKSADPVTYDDKGNVIPLSERFNAENKDIRYSLSKKDFSIAPPVGADVRGQDIGYDIAPPVPESVRRASSAGRGPLDVNDPNYAPRLEGSANQSQQGAAQAGKQRKWVKTSTERDAVNRQILPDELDATNITYEPVSNKKTLGNANAKLETIGYDGAVEYFNNQIYAEKVSLDDIALGERLIQEAIKMGDTMNAGELIQNIAILGTELGQKVQALSIIQRLTPEGQLKMLQKIVNRGKAKGDNTFNGVEITQDMIDHILSVYGKDGSYDQNNLNRAVEEVKQQIADQMTVTKMEKVNGWRYLSMLGNPKTHIRNILSNLANMGTIAVKDTVARTIESVIPVDQRTKTWKPASSDVKDFAKKTTEEMKDQITGEGKYNDTSDIKAKRDTFNTKILQRVYGFNSDLLSKEDWWFSKPAFKQSFQEFLTANGVETAQDIQNNPKLVEKAKKYALERAEIATFRQASWLASKLSSLEKKNAATQVIFGSVIPFKKTPINVAKAGLSYSPLGFAKTLTYDIVQVKKGNVAASELVDHLAQNLTGTGLALVGYWLARIGFLNGAGEDDKEGTYDSYLGEQAYSVNIGKNTYSLSWLSPTAMPLFVGANLYEQLVEGKEWNADVVLETLAQTLDPMSEMSFLSSLDDVLSSYDSGMEKFAGIGVSALSSYASQFIPTALSQTAATIDDTKHTTKVAANSGSKVIDEVVNQMMYKIPLLRQLLQPSTDIWGNEIKQSENVAVRALENFVAPWSRKENISSAVDDELKELYSEVGEDGILPSIPENTVTYKGKKYPMSAAEFTAYKETYGQTAYKQLEKLFQTATYRNAAPADQAELVGEVYKYASDVAKKEYLAGRDVEYTNTTKDNVPIYKENAIKGAIENDMIPEEYDLYRTNYPQYTVSKAVGGYEAYKGYRKGLSNIRADKGQNGETIDGSRKKKVQAYINGLDAGYYEKLILWKREYPSDDTYNTEIINYLNRRTDISHTEMKTILEELGFKVSASGKITWD